MPTQPRFRPALAHVLPLLLLALLILRTTPPAAQDHQIRDYGAPVTILAAGDIANCRKSFKKKLKVWLAGEDPYYGAPRTAALLERLPGTILVMGDIAYPTGSAEDFQDCFEPAWGKFKDRIMPVPGNHEYDTDDADPYYDYFGERVGERGRGYYSFQLGAWHIVALNSVLDEEGRADQENWLRDDLALSDARCILAYWHHPIYSSGDHGASDRMAGAFRILYDAGASVVLSGHDHNYERLAPVAPNGRADPRRGIRTFVVGTGGHSLDPIYRADPNSEVFDGTSWGLLRMELHEDRYRWEFIPVEGHDFRDSGEERCVGGRRLFRESPDGEDARVKPRNRATGSPGRRSG